MTTSTKLNWILGVAVVALLFAGGWLVGELVRSRGEVRRCNADIQLLQQFRIDTVYYPETITRIITKYKPGQVITRWQTDTVEVPDWLNIDSLYYLAVDSIKNDSIELKWQAGVFGWLSSMDISYRLKQPKIVYERIPVNVPVKDRTEWAVFAAGAFNTFQAGIEATMPNNTGIMVGYDLKSKSPVIGMRLRLRKGYTH